MNEKYYNLKKDSNGRWTVFHPTGVYSHQTSENLLGILVKRLNEVCENRDKIEEDYLDFSLHVEKILQEEYTKSNIPIWKYEYLEDLAYKMGMSLK